MRKREDNFVDQEVLAFVKKVYEGKYVKPITVGFITEKEANQIEELTGLKVCGNRITLDRDAVVHIEKRHGAKGLSDHSMKDNKDIARISYILSNYDAIMLSQNRSSKYKTIANEPAPHIIVIKEMKDIYYVIEAVSDAKTSTNHIVSMYKQSKKAAISSAENAEAPAKRP